MFNNDKVFIIAEIGYNHNGNFDKAKLLVDKVSEIEEIDCVKFQIDSPDKIYSLRHNKEGYDFFSKIQLNQDEFRDIFKYIKNKSKKPLFSISDYDLIENYLEHGLDLMKIASSSLCNYRLFEVIFKHKIPTIASVGVSDIKDMTDIYREFKERNIPLALLYCVSMYPASVDKISIGNIIMMKNLFPGITIGYSDHTKLSEVVLSAVSAGAKIIEVHVMLDDDKEALEKDVSYTVSDLKNLVKAVRNVEIALDNKNDDRILLNKDIKESRLKYFRSVYLEYDMKAGEKVNIEKVVFKRPNLGVSSNLWKLAEGRQLKRDKAKDEPLFWGDIE